MAQIGGVTALALLVAGRTPAARLPHAPVPAGKARSVGELKFCIRDVSTGYGVRAVILLYPTQGVGPDRSGGRWVPPRTNPLVLQSDPQGRGRYKLPARAYLAEVSAQGYLPLRTDWVIDAGSTLPTTVMMEPERPPEVPPQRGSFAPAAPMGVAGGTQCDERRRPPEQAIRSTSQNL